MSSKVMAEDIEHLRTYLGLATFPTLLGHCHDGCIVLRYAEQYPERVEKMILISAAVHDGPANDNFKNWAARRKDDPVQGPALAAAAAVGQACLTTDE